MKITTNDYTNENVNYKLDIMTSGISIYNNEESILDIILKDNCQVEIDKNTLQ